ncbi:MAG: heat-inducible transcriptional repressor HrcA [Acutalibacteraceae bacterium]
MLTSRQKEILNRIVLLYEKTSEPVGSKAICDEMGLSSATIRNEMSELSDLGYLEQPHTSAGRIPSQTAYRVYVNELIKKDELSKKEKYFIENAVFSANAPDAIISKACEILSEITGLMSVSSTPNDSNSVINKAEIIPVGNHTCLLVLLISSGTIKSRPCRIDDALSAREISIFSAACENEFRDIPLIEIDKGKIQSLFANLGASSLKFTNISETLYSLIEEACKCELKSGGELNLFSSGEIPFEKVKKILSLLRKQDSILDLLCFASSPVDVMIGDEMKNDALSYSSLITADYSFSDKMGGKIGVIGSTKINYAHLIPCVEYTAGVVGSAISSLLRQDGRNIYVQIR